MLKLQFHEPVHGQLAVSQTEATLQRIIVALHTMAGKMDHVTLGQLRLEVEQCGRAYEACYRNARCSECLLNTLSFVLHIGNRGQRVELSSRFSK
jgi:hypothetical protein